MTNDSTEAGKPAPAAEPLALRLNDGLGLIPARCNAGTAQLAHNDATELWARAEVLAMLSAERERCAKLCEQEHQESGEHPEMALHCAERIRGLRI